MPLKKQKYELTMPENIIERKPGCRFYFDGERVNVNFLPVIFRYVNVYPNTNDVLLFFSRKISILYCLW